MRECLIAECGSPVLARGYCVKHYSRLVRTGDPNTVSFIVGDDLARLHASIVIAPSGCWEWQRGCDAHGYGRMNFRRKQRLVHRAAYELLVGPIPPGMLVCHRCDNPPCCNPAHLFIGTHKDNTADMMSKGRRNPGVHPWESRTHGTRNANAKLTDAKVLELRARAAKGEHYTTLAVAYGISASRANAIILRNGWRHI